LVIKVLAGHKIHHLPYSRNSAGKHALSRSLKEGPWELSTPALVEAIPRNRGLKKQTEKIGKKRSWGWGKERKREERNGNKKNTYSSAPLIE